MRQSIVVLSGSPRRNGNTDRLAAAFVEGAQSTGKNVTLFRTADMDISGCRGCNRCFDTKGVCVQTDDMSVILDAIKQADILVLASPVYFFSVSAQLKLAVDRTYALMNAELSVKKAALLLTCGDDTEEVAKGAVVTYKTICSYSKWEDAGIIIAPRLHSPHDIEGREELEMARKLGREIAV